MMIDMIPEVRRAMPEELTDLLDAAIYKEVASEDFYTAGHNLTANPGAKALMKELAEQEQRHAQWLKELKEKGLRSSQWHAEKIKDLKISDYLIGGYSLENASIQDVLIFAMKR